MGGTEERGEEMYHSSCMTGGATSNEDEDIINSQSSPVSHLILNFIMEFVLFSLHR